MKKLTPDHFSFKCPMNWDAMTPNAAGRFCDRCAKQVHDLTDCSLEEVRELQRRQGPICGMVRLVGAAAVAASLSSAACNKPQQAAESADSSPPSQAAPEDPKPPQPPALQPPAPEPPAPEDPKPPQPPALEPEPAKPRPPKIEVVPEIQIMGFICPPDLQPPAKDDGPI